MYPLLTDDNAADENLDKSNSLLISVSHTRIILSNHSLPSWLRYFQYPLPLPDAILSASAFNAAFILQITTTAAAAITVKKI